MLSGKYCIKTILSIRNLASKGLSVDYSKVVNNFKKMQKNEAITICKTGVEVEFNNAVGIKLSIFGRN